MISKTPSPDLTFSLDFQVHRRRVQNELRCPATELDHITAAIHCLNIQRNAMRSLRYHMTLTAKTAIPKLTMQTVWKPPPGAAKCFFTYNDIAVEFPSPRGKRERVTLLRDRDQTGLDLRRLFYRGFVIPKDLGETYADIQWHGRITMFYYPAVNRAIALLDRAEMERLYYQLIPGPLLQCIHGAPLLAKAAVCYADMEIITYKPINRTFWWQEGLEYANQTGLRQWLFRLAVTPRSIQAGNQALMTVLGGKGKQMSLTVCRVGQAQPVRQAQSIAPNASVYQRPLNTHGWKSGIYQITLKSGLRKRDTLCVVRPPKPTGAILFVTATNAWRSYAMNGHYHGEMDHIYPWSYSYSATLLEGVSDIESDVAASYRYPMQRNYYNNMPSGFARTTEGLVVALREFAREHGVATDFCAEEDVHFNRVDLSHYRLVIIDNHAEYSTDKELARFQQHVRHGGRFLIIGGDNFGRKVEYVMEHDDMRYQYLYGHTVCQKYPHGAQYSDKMRLKRFGLTYVASPAYREKCALTIANNEHPITRGYRVGEVISDTRWEGDRVDSSWDVLANVNFFKRKLAFPSLAVHRKYQMVYFGPMGIAETLAGYYGNRDAVRLLFFNILKYQLNRRS